MIKFICKEENYQAYYTFDLDNISKLRNYVSQIFTNARYKLIEEIFIIVLTKKDTATNVFSLGLVRK